MIGNREVGTMNNKYSVAWTPKFVVKNKSKYKAVKTVVDGIKFDSKKEANYYLMLKQMQQQGKISSLKLQPKFLLQEGYIGRDGKRVRAITYIADFQYTDEDGNNIVVDVKSKITEANPVYRLKKKMFGYLYPDYEFVEKVM